MTNLSENDITIINNFGKQLCKEIEKNTKI